MSYRLRVSCWVGWIGVIIAVVVPWTTFRSHSHWDRVLWVPFVSPPVKPVDIIANVLFYVPFGAFYAWAWFRHRWRAVAYAMVLSVATEFTQVFSHGRFPSTTDVVSNVLGACAGIVLVDAWFRRIAL